MSDPTFPPISIIMPCYNSADTLGKALDSILDLDYPEFEVVVVDDCSADNSYDIARRYMALSPLVRLYRLEHNSGVQVARDFATRQARYEWIASTDSDAEVPRDWLKKASKHFAFSAMVGGRFLADPASIIEKGLNAVYSSKVIACSLYSIATTRLDPYVVGNNFFYQKSVFETVEGYDPEIRAAEEVLLVARGIESGYTYLFDPELLVRHPFTPRCLTFVEFLHRFYQSSKWRKAAAAKSRLIRNRNLVTVAGTIAVLTAFLIFPYIFGLLFGWSIFCGVGIVALLIQSVRAYRGKPASFILCLLGSGLKFIRRLVCTMAIILPSNPTRTGWSKRG